MDVLLMGIQARFYKARLHTGYASGRLRLDGLRGSVC